MSLILEALRKSEAQRRRGQTPDLHAELPPVLVQRRAPIPAWAWLLLASAILLLAIWLTRAPGPARTASLQATEAGTTADRETTTAPDLPAVPRLLPSAAAAGATPTPAPALPAQPAQPTPPAAAAPQPVATMPQPEAVSITPAVVAALPIATTASDILQLSDLSATERKSLPPLKLSMHLWNDDPARRFVILDGNRLVEGDRVGVGDAVVAAITADGVLLDWNGRRLKLPIR